MSLASICPIRSNPSDFCHHGPEKERELGSKPSTTMPEAEEIVQHNSRTSCWIVISGQVYDVTDFLDSHPGGPGIILRYAGKDATAVYAPIHPDGTIEKSLDPSKHLGGVDGPLDWLQPDGEEVQEERSRDEIAPLSTLQNLDDIGREAQKALAKKGWVYYSSSADTTTSFARNRADWSRILFRPRILRNVARVDMRRRILGFESNLPFFIAPAAMAKLGHEEGELCLTRGAARWNIPQVTSNSSSTAHGEMAACLAEEQGEGKGGVLFWQLYVPVDKPRARERIEEAKRLGFKALIITVDTAVIGKREEDERYKAELDHAAGVETSRTRYASGDNAVLRGVHSSTLCWDDLPWMKEIWGNTGPVVLKGIQTAEDALMACQAGMDGIYLSNHGGRQLDHAPSSVRTLLEIRRHCPEILGKMEVFLDGGVRRGSDIVKALCLGATAVGLGRPFLYALSGYGTAGVERAIQCKCSQKCSRAFRRRTTMWKMKLTRLQC